MKLLEIKQKISQLISQETEKNEKQKGRLKFLFSRLEEVKELETVSRLRELSGESKYLEIYLTYKSIVRANYQPELTSLTKGDESRFLELMEKDLEVFEAQETPKKKRISNLELLTELKSRVGSGEIEPRLLKLEIVLETLSDLKESSSWIEKTSNQFLEKYNLK